MYAVKMSKRVADAANAAFAVASKARSRLMAISEAGKATERNV